MAKSKRKTATTKSVSSKKKKDDTSHVQHSGPSFDDLCDNTLLRILSYTDDLRSLISLTRCTSKSLRKRFDLKGDKNAPEYSEQYKKFWQGVFADLQMTPLEESDSKSQDYIAAINYRLSLFNTLIGHEKRKKAGTNRSYSLPLRQHNFKPFNASWNYDDDEEEPQDTMANPFTLMSWGTGQEYVIVDPYSDSVEVHKSIIERVQCLDKSVQKKRETATTSTAPIIKPRQVLLRSYRHSLPSMASSWEDYFGNDTPFGPYDDLPPEDTRRMGVGRVSIQTFNSMDDERMVFKEKIIILCRLIGYQDENYCTEIIVWGDSGYKERSPSKRFELKSMVRIPSQTHLNDVS